MAESSRRERAIAPTGDFLAKNLATKSDRNFAPFENERHWFKFPRICGLFASIFTFSSGNI
jgi:hypothetical protein